MSELETRLYVNELLTRYHELELFKIEHPAFNVKDIWRAIDGTVTVMVDDLRAIEEVADYDEEGRLMYMGAEWVKRHEDND